MQPQLSALFSVCFIKINLNSNDAVINCFHPTLILSMVFFPRSIIFSFYFYQNIFHLKAKLKHVAAEDRSMELKVKYDGLQELIATLKDSQGAKKVNYSHTDIFYWIIIRVCIVLALFSMSVLLVKCMLC